MNTSIVLTVIAEDRPGIVQTVSESLARHGGNWTQSSMSTLAGQFAGILLTTVPTENTDACLAELRELESQGLRITAHESGQQAVPENVGSYTLELVGNDHPGIIHDITTLLASRNISVLSLETSVESASMGGAELFKARAKLLMSEATDIDSLIGELEDLANDLMVNIHFE